MKLCGFDVGLERPFFLIAGPCVVESEALQMDVAGRLKPAFDRAVSDGSGDRTTTEGYEAPQATETDRQERSR